MITAYGKEDTEKVAKEKGAWAYVEKPFIIGKIKDLLKMVCRNNPEFYLN